MLRLSEDLKQLQLDNAALREEMNTDSPAAGIKGCLPRTQRFLTTVRAQNARRATSIRSVLQLAILLFVQHKESFLLGRTLDESCFLKPCSVLKT